MTTAPLINYDAITTQDALNSLYRVMAKTLDRENLAEEDLRVISYALENNLQIRDYLMGISAEYDIYDAIFIIHTIEENLDSLNLCVYPIRTILSSYMYRTDNKEDAMQLLEDGLAVNYSLANLLNRVFNAGWSSEDFNTMAIELHPKVCKELQETSTLIVNESLR